MLPLSSVRVPLLTVPLKAAQRADGERVSELREVTTMLSTLTLFVAVKVAVVFCPPQTQ